MRVFSGLLLSAAALGTCAAYHKGIVFGGDEWSPPMFPFNSSAAVDSLAALAHTGASHVRIIFTWYQDNINTTRIYPIPPPSPLASASLAQVESAIQAARALGLNVTLCPILDPNWDWNNAFNGRSTVAPHATSRLQIGAYYSESDWSDWFANYTSYVLPFAALAGKYDIALFEVASELDVAFSTRDGQWRQVVAAIKGLYTGPLSIACDFYKISNITWWDALDFIGGDMYGGLGSLLPLGQAPTVDDLVAAWAPYVEQIEAAVNATGKDFIITEVGYQSRSSCHVRPWGTQLHDVDDDSAWLEDHDPACQAAAYEALFRVFTPKPWFAGVYFWLWRTDPTHGGTGDSDFTPHGKPAEVVLRRWYGNYTCPAAGGYGSAYLAPGPESTGARAGQTWVPLASDGSDAACDGSGAVADAVAAAHAGYVAARRPLAPHLNVTKKTWNGFCLGGPDEWSYPGYRFDSVGAQRSLDAMLTTGADSVEIIVQWYYENATDVVMYPVVDTSDPLRTSTDEELASMVSYAQSKGLKTLLTLMLDPQWTLPAQNWCRDSSAPGCYWRGQIGIFWGDDCTPGSQWAAWFANYKAALLHYARLAEAWGVDAFLLSHELENANQHCPALWYDLLTSVRAVYSGNVTAAFQPSLLNTLALSPWAGGADGLDFIGIDCYMQLPLPNTNGSTHSPLPWQDADLSVLLAAAQQLMPAFANLSAAAGKKIVCTEVGTTTRPWTWSSWGGMKFVDPEDCSVYDQCIAPHAQELFYQWYMATYYPQPWFDGVLFWTWRADPTSGGTSDDGLVPTGKPAVGVIASYWLP